MKKIVVFLIILLSMFFSIWAQRIISPGFSGEYFYWNGLKKISINDQKLYFDHMFFDIFEKLHALNLIPPEGNIDELITKNLDRLISELIDKLRDFDLPPNFGVRLDY